MADIGREVLELFISDELSGICAQLSMVTFPARWMCLLPMQRASALGPLGKGQTEAVEYCCCAGVLQENKSTVPVEGLRRAKRQEKSLQPFSFTRGKLVRTVREEAKENRVTPKDL